MRKRSLLLLSLLITTTICGAALYLTADEGTWDRFHTYPPVYLLIALGAVAGDIFVRSARLVIMASAIGRRLTVRQAATVTLQGDFAAAITPSRVGGEPARLYALTRLGNSWSQVGVILAGELLTDLLFVIVLVLSLSLAHAWRAAQMTGGGVEEGGLTFLPTLCLIAAASAAAYVVIWRPNLRERVLLRASGLPGLHRVLTLDRARKLNGQLGEAVGDVHRSLSYLRETGKTRAALCGLVVFGHGVVRFAILPILVRWCGAPVGLWTLILWQVLIFYGFAFVPTPGGSGAQEAAFVLFFTSYIPTDTVGLLLVVWRFFTYYLYLILGGIASFGLLRDSVSARRAARPSEAISGQQRRSSAVRNT